MINPLLVKLELVGLSSWASFQKIRCNKMFAYLGEAVRHLMAKVQMVFR